jgi:hypothetical protein
MTESLRERMIEFHGREAGEQLYATALKNHAAAERLSVLNLALDQARGQFGAAIEAARLHVSELQDVASRAYSDWFDACNELERAKIELQQKKAQLRDLTQAILEEMKGRPRPPDLVKQWERPSWYTETLETKANGS